jgi:hypothetical protein
MSIAKLPNCCCRWCVFSLLILMILSLSAPAAERSEDLSGEAEIAQPSLATPDSAEPERGMAGATKERPVLKLPEVIVKGDRQYRVSAERRDLLLMDPMWGMKEIPADMAQVAVPGLQEQKTAPQGDTLNARPYVFTLEGGAGTSRLGLGRLVAGWETQSFQAGIRADYAAGETPEAYGVIPYDQEANATVDIGGTPVSGWEVNGEVSGRAGSHRQPQPGWGEWLEQGLGQVRLGTALRLTSHTLLNAAAGWEMATELGQENSQGQLQARTLNFQTGLEQDITGLTVSDLNLTLQYDVWQQATQVQLTSTPDQNLDETLQQAMARLRFRPVSSLLLDGGIRWNDFTGPVSRTTANVVGQISVLLPTGSVLYGSGDAGLEWALVSEWMFQHPRPSLFWNPEPENVLGNFRLGWRQRWSEQISMDLAGFRREAEQTPVWMDEDRNGLFTLVNLPHTLVTGAVLEVEISYTEQLTQSVSYTYRQADAGGLRYPYLPQHEGETEVRWSSGGVSLELRYRYLGVRAAVPSEPDPSLGAAHLLESHADFPLLKNLDGFLDLKNMLNYAWEEWQGYPGRGFSVLGGLRLHF